MSSNLPPLYDPNPIELQFLALDQISTKELQPTDLSTPEVVQLLVHNHRVTLAQLNVSENKVANLQNENTQLKVDIAKHEGIMNSSWLEIPISMLSGFAINMLAADSQNGVGWFLLIMSLFMLIGLRSHQISSALERLVQILTKRNDNA